MTRKLEIFLQTQILGKNKARKKKILAIRLAVSERLRRFDFVGILLSFINVNKLTARFREILKRSFALTALRRHNI